MSYLQQNNIILDSKITNYGRQKIAEGNFNVKYFQIGDSECDYNGTPSGQTIIKSMDKDSVVKYPFFLTEVSSGSTTGVTFGTPILAKQTEPIIYSGTTSTGWSLNVVWSVKPIGTTNQISTFGSYKYLSSKDFFGYTNTSNQLTNTGTTVTNSFSGVTTVLPEEQQCIAIIHYENNQYECDDYISGDTHFSINLTGITYDRISGNITGVTLNLGGNPTPKYVNSSAVDSWSNNIKYYDLKDVSGNTVGKAFTEHQIIVIDDQELVAVLDSGTSRTYTLPIPKLDYVPSDIKCQPTNNNDDPLLSGITTGNTYYVTYMLQDGNTTTFPCNQILKITGTTEDCDLSIKFGENSFNHMTTGGTYGTYRANKFYILYQYVVGDGLPEPNGWYVIDYQTDIQSASGYTGGYINPTYLRGARFIIDKEAVNSSIGYTYGGTNTFGSDSVLKGSVNVNSVTDIQVLGFNINLPDGQFSTSQNKTWVSGKDKYMTEVHLLDDNYKTLVVSKFSTPQRRVGHQVIGIKLDI